MPDLTPATLASANSAFANGGATGSLPLVIAKSAIPFVDPGSHTMGNNGALSALSVALPVAYANSYVWFAVNQIAAGVPAGWYFAQWSTTQACTVFNNTYTSGVPTIPSSPTAFATTGPGAITGTTTENFGATITVPANSMGSTGSLAFLLDWSVNNTANNKTNRLRFSGQAGTQFLTNTFASLTGGTTTGYIENRGATNSQVGSSKSVCNNGGSLATAAAYSAVDTTAATTLVVSSQKATATDNIILEAFRFSLIPG